LLRVRPPRFDLYFASPTRFRDVSDPPRPFEGEIAWTGLPTGRMPNPTVGGGRATFGEPSTRLPAVRRNGAPPAEAAVLGRPVRLSGDGRADGPLRLSTKLAASLPLR